MLQNIKIKRLFKTAAGLLLFCWMVYSLYTQVKHQPNLKNTLSALQTQIEQAGFNFLTLLFLLMLVNWSIEALKWKSLLKGTERISFLKSFQSVLTGVAVSMITPNRVGEYLGRILYLRNIHKLQGITVTLVGSFAQLVVTGTWGVVGLVCYLQQVKASPGLRLFMVVSVLLLVVLLILLARLHQVVDRTSRLPLFRKARTYLYILKRFDRVQLVRILFLSTLRYFIYTLQFVVLLKLFLVDIPLPAMVCSIWVIFWAMAIVPTIAIAELGIRGETALFFLLPFSTNQLGIISSTVLLWSVNLVIPALIGCLWVYNIKIYAEE